MVRSFSEIKLSRVVYCTSRAVPAILFSTIRSSLQLSNVENIPHFGFCCATEPGFAGDIGAIEVLLID